MFRKTLIVSLVFSSAFLAPSISNAVEKYSAIVVEEKTGQVLFARNADRPQNLGALAKIMTSYIFFEEVRSKKLSLKTKLVLGEVANRPAQQWD